MENIVQDWKSRTLMWTSHPLKDWDPSWYTGPNHQWFGVQYGKCKLIALEFIDVYVCHLSTKHLN